MTPELSAGAEVVRQDWVAELKAKGVSIEDNASMLEVIEERARQDLRDRATAVGLFEGSSVREIVNAEVAKKQKERIAAVALRSSEKH